MEGVAVKVTLILWVPSPPWTLVGQVISPSFLHPGCEGGIRGLFSRAYVRQFVGSSPTYPTLYIAANLIRSHRSIEGPRTYTNL
jgi:hypothetical protein